MNENKLVVEQPAPTPNASRPIWELVVEDMLARDNEGRRKYGVPLQAFNDRDPLIDLYQEILDAAVYTRQAIEERKITLAPLLELERLILEESAYQHWQLDESGLDGFNQVLDWIRKLKRLCGFECGLNNLCESMTKSEFSVDTPRLRA